MRWALGVPGLSRPYTVHGASLVMISKLTAIAFTVLSIGFLSACGGGGGGGGNDAESSGAAQLALQSEPRNVDTGSRVEVRIGIADVATDGVMLKVRFSPQLSFVPGSTQFTADGNTRTIIPTITTGAAGGYKYLVYFLSRQMFTDDNYADIDLSLRADQVSNDAVIQVDADYPDPVVPDYNEFNPNDPQFTPVSETYVDIY